MKWREAIVIARGDDMNVACANNKSVSVWGIACGIKFPHARFFPHALANLTQSPRILPPHGALTTLTAHSMVVKRMSRVPSRACNRSRMGLHCR